MTERMITKGDLASIGGMEFELKAKQGLSIAQCKEIGTWPEDMPEDVDYILAPTIVFKRSARECAQELGTTARQISKLRNGKIKEAKPLSWYSKNDKPTGDATKEKKKKTKW